MPMPGFQFAYNTPILDPAKWDAYASWMQGMGLDPVEAAADYDYQGAFLKNLSRDGRMYWDDEFKKPNHATFSGFSKYAEPTHPGGVWPGGRDYYAPDPVAPNFRTPREMREYMAREEPGARLFSGAMFLPRLMFPDYYPKQ